MDITDMLFFPPKDMPSLAEGEALFFTRDPGMADTLAVLCGVSGKPAPGTAPRLRLCDGDDADMRAEARRTAPGTPILFYASDPARCTPPPAVRFRVLGRPFPFDELCRAAAELLTDVPLAPPKDRPAPPRIRVEGNTAVADGIRVPLSPCEAAVLRMLTDAYPEAVSRETLAGAFARRGGNTVSVYVTYLRRKLAALTAFQGILSERGGRFALVLRGDPPIPKPNKGRDTL